MQLTLDPWRARLIRRMPQRFPYVWVEAALVIVIAVQTARLIWIAFAPLGPVGDWKGAASALATDASTLKTFDPFFSMSAQFGSAVVTSLPLKLFGVRVDQATGRGSAIIETPDGIQQSFAVGDEVMPGIRLAAVAKDNVTIDRGGAAEQLYLDQSVPAPVAEPAMTSSPAASVPAGSVPAIATPAPPPAMPPGMVMGAGSRGMTRPPPPGEAPK